MATSDAFDDHQPSTLHAGKPAQPYQSSVNSDDKRPTNSPQLYSDDGGTTPQNTHGVCNQPNTSRAASVDATTGPTILQEVLDDIKRELGIPVDVIARSQNSAVLLSLQLNAVTRLTRMMILFQRHEMREFERLLREADYISRRIADEELVARCSFWCAAAFAEYKTEPETAEILIGALPIHSIDCYEATQLPEWVSKYFVIIQEHIKESTQDPEVVSRQLEVVRDLVHRHSIDVQRRKPHMNQHEHRHYGGQHETQSVSGDENRDALFKDLLEQVQRTVDSPSSTSFNRGHDMPQDVTVSHPSASPVAVTNSSASPRKFEGIDDVLKSLRQKPVRHMQNRVKDGKALNRGLKLNKDIAQRIDNLAKAAVSSAPNDINITIAEASNEDQVSNELAEQLGSFAMEHYQVSNKNVKMIPSPNLSPRSTAELVEASAKQAAARRTSSSNSNSVGSVIKQQWAQRGGINDHTAPSVSVALNVPQPRREVDSPETPKDVELSDALAIEQVDQRVQTSMGRRRSAGAITSPTLVVTTHNLPRQPFSDMSAISPSSRRNGTPVTSSPLRNSIAPEDVQLTGDDGK